jgi:hypothetical protein
VYVTRNKTRGKRFNMTRFADASEKFDRVCGPKGLVTRMRFHVQLAAYRRCDWLYLRFGV